MENNKEFDYPEAGINVHPGVKQAIENFRRLPLDIRSKKPLLYWLLGSGTPPYKMSKKDANYVGKTINGKNCGNCRFAFQRVANDEYICSQMRGNISLNHWCRLWVSGETAIPHKNK